MSRRHTFMHIVQSAMLMLALGFAFALPALSIGARDRVGIILSNLPPPSEPAYKALRKIAGDADIQLLEMTKAEMWSVAPADVDALVTAAERQNVTVKKLDEFWNRTLAPMAAGAEMTTEQKAMMAETMASKAVMGMSMMALPDAKELEYALTKDMNAEGAPPPQLVIPLNDNLTVTATRTSISKTSENYIWHGSVDETGEPVTLLWWPSGRLTGSVTYNGHVFSVKDIGGGMHGVIEMSPDGLPPEHAPLGRDMMEKMKMKSDPLVQKGAADLLRTPADGPKDRETESGKPERGHTKNLEDARLESTEKKQVLALSLDRPKHKARKQNEVVIRVLVAYTPAAAAHYSNIETDLIALAIEDANQSFRSSGIGHVRLELAHAYKTGYVENGSHFDHVFRFADKGDGYMDEVHALRDQYRADVGVLIVHDPQGCGLAAQVVAPADRAFAAVHHECAATSYSLAHEIGHLIGARHDLALDDDLKPFPYGHGFVFEKSWRTMMSYKESCDGCPRFPIWSNPKLRVKGIPAGDAKSDNARVIAEQAARVAAFR